MRTREQLIEEMRQQDLEYERALSIESKRQRQYENRTRAELKLRAKYKMGFEDWARLYEAQDGKCPGCDLRLGFGPDDFATDHDHVTGIVRGSLCRQCNVALGIVGDSAERLENLAQYLRRTDLAYAT